MLKNKTKIITIFLILILLFSTVSVLADDEVNENEIMPISTDNATEEVQNAVENATSNAQAQEDSYKKSDVYLTGDNVTVDYIVDGNLFVMADTVTINSQIGGDAFILAKKLIINEDGYIFSNLFTIAESVETKGVVYDVYALTKNFTISGGYVYRDLKVCGETLNINGIVGRNAFVNCPNINFNTNDDNKGIIYGDLNYSSNSEISIPENVVSGNVNYSASKTSTEKSTRSIIANYILDLGAFIAFVLIIWLICLALAPKFLASTNKYVGKKSLNIFGKGLLTLIVTPIICIILIFLQLTSGFSLFLLALYVLAIILSKSLFTITANNYVCSKLNVNKNTGIFGMLIVSGIVIWVITKLPYIGGLVSFIIAVLGLGILVVSILPERAKKNKDSLKEDTSKEIKNTDKNDEE